jgi:hypothetical protein
MNIQRPHDAANNLAHFIEEVDRAATHESLIQIKTAPPTYGAPQRDAITSCVDSLVADLCNRIGDLRKVLDVIEQQVLQGAAVSKHALNEQVGVCVRVDAEIRRMHDVIADLASETHVA